MRGYLVSLIAAVALVTSTAKAEEVGEVGVDWVGNDIEIEALHDPEVEGVTCHIAYFDRSMIDRLSKGNWFEDPSNSSISCRQTGEIRIGDIELDKGGEEVFKQGRSLIFKQLVINRIYDHSNKTLIYLAHTREITEGSSKMSMSTVPLYGQDVVWENGAPD